MKIKLVVFDIAGTTVKDRGEIAGAFQSALADFGYQIPIEKINLFMGYHKPEAIKKILNEFENDKSLLNEAHIQRIYKKFLILMVQYYEQTTELEPLPFAEELFDFLHKNGIKVALDTGFSKEITDIIIERLGWLKNKLIDYYICSDEVSLGRPHPLMIENVMQHFGIINASEVIKVGDTEVDVNEGLNAGCKFSIGITTGAFSEDQLKPYNPHFIINNLEEMIPILNPLL